MGLDVFGILVPTHLPNPTKKPAMQTANHRQRHLPVRAVADQEMPHCPWLAVCSAGLPAGSGRWIGTRIPNTPEPISTCQQ